MSDIDENVVTEKVEHFKGNFKLKDLANEYIINPNDTNFKKLKEEIGRSSGLSTAYVLDHIREVKENCDGLHDLLYEEYVVGQQSETEYYDPKLGEFVDKEGNSKKKSM